MAGFCLVPGYIIFCISSETEFKEWLVPLKIVFNVLRFNLALNQSRYLADLRRGSNSLNSDSVKLSFYNAFYFIRMSIFKGTVSVISSDRLFALPYLQDYHNFVWSEWIRYQCFSFGKLLLFISGFSAKETCAFLAYKETGEIIRIKHF